MDDIVLAEMHGAYMRRKLFEAKLIANEVAKVLGGAMGGSGTRQGNHNDVKDLDTFVAGMGSKWH
jgi:hypothetical protein